MRTPTGRANKTNIGFRSFKSFQVKKGKTNKGRDTIGYKIPELQERKRKLASELIAGDASFVKALSKSDVEYLFS